MGGGANASNRKAVDEILDSTGAKSGQKIDNPATVLKIFLAERDRSEDEIVSEVRRLQLSRGLDDQHKTKILIEALIDTSAPKTVAKQFSTHAKLLSRYVRDDAQAVCLLGCVEELVGVAAKDLLKKTPHILQALYEADVLSEDQCLAWASSPPESSWLVNKEVAQSVREAAQPFVTWLQEAEEESDSD